MIYTESAPRNGAVTTGVEIMERLETPRPPFLDADSRSSSPSGFTRPESSLERVQHYAGDIPPSLSPLDAFAAHSRRLAKELEEARQTGEKRVSRLPPHVVTKSLIAHQANRPHYFRSLSGSSSPATSPGPQESDGPGNSPEVAHPIKRPISSYPRLSSIPASPADVEDQIDTFVTPREIPTALLQPSRKTTDYFGIPRVQSPEPADTGGIGGSSHETEVQRSPTAARITTESTVAPPRLIIEDKLVPPKAPFARDNHPNRSQTDNSDDEYTSSNAGSTFSAVRRLSSHSNISAPQTPASPFATHSHLRSASGTSTGSAQSGRGSRAHLNFSRPISSASSNNLRDSPIKHRSKVSQLSHPSALSLDLPRTPLSFDEPRPRKSDDGYATSSSYTYGKFSLPRGRMADRQSQVFLGLSTPPFEWQEPLFPATPPPSSPTAPRMTKMSTELSRPSKDTVRSNAAGFSFDLGSEPRPSQERPQRPTTSHSAAGSAKTNTSTPRPSTSHGSSSRPIMPPMPTIASGSSQPSISSRSNSTVRPSTAHTVSQTQTLTPEEHVAKGIQLHEHGDLKESTYHLRIAAKQDHPTGMLLYALACRHGWGMRSNPKEGVSWLRRAMDAAQLEVANDDENPNANASGGSVGGKDLSEKKAHRAQFALSIYELGVSHLNGWGTEQDKPLALRCFEIAGDWGDADALTEAGFCYAEGIGCKKDLRKAAKFYRRAADRGVSMVGNSWIYKDKYNDDPTPSSKAADRKTRSRSGSKAAPSLTSSPLKQLQQPRSKSKTRSFFGRKRSVSAAVGV